jgi:hypothetical protein
LRGKIDILGLDLCTMSMVEVADTVRDAVNYIVGSEGYVDNAGWPYHRLLELMRSPQSPAKLAKNVVEKYFAYYCDYLVARVSADQAAVKIESEWQENLITPLAELASLLGKALDPDSKGDVPDTKRRMVSDALVLAHWKAQSFNHEQHTDLYDFCFCLKNSLVPDLDTKEAPPLKRVFNDQSRYKNVEDIYRACDKVMSGVKAVVLTALYSGAEYQHAHGLSVYFPWSEVDLSYLDTDFARRTGWGNFLKHYVKATCRDLRVDKDLQEKGERPVSMAVECQDGVVGTGGYPAYRSGAERPRSGGAERPRSGGVDRPRSGGWERPRTGELSTADLLRLSSMKNWPVQYFQNKKKLKEIISRLTGSMSEQQKALIAQISQLQEP